MRNMPLTLIPARPSDAARIAEIHMAAFGSNGMLLAQFPTPAVRAALKTCIERKALDDINDPKTSVLVVRESPPRKEDLNGELEAEDSGEIISFAKWSHPILEGEDYVEPPWIWPEGTRMDVLEKWGSKLEEAQERALGGAPCYRITFIGTDPRYERRGAASLMVQWGLERCRAENYPAYLESTMNAVPLYDRHGFVAVEKIYLELETANEDGKPESYTEIGLLYRP